MSQAKPSSSASKLFAAFLAMGVVGASGVSSAVEPGANGIDEVRIGQPTESRVPARDEDRLSGPTTSRRSTQRFNDIDSAIRAVRTAASTNEVVDAYAGGMVLDRDNVALQEAYIRRLVELNAPAMAEPVARRLASENPDSPLAWAVLAFSEAKRGSMPDALADIGIAARKAPDDPFIQRTTGELLAWYDNAAPRPTLAAGVASDLEAARRDLASRPTYAEAYGKASEFYKNPPQQPDANAGTAQTGPTRTPDYRDDIRPDVPDDFRRNDVTRDDAVDDGYVGDSYVRKVPAPVYVDRYVPEYVPEYVPSYYAGPAYYDGWDVSLGIGPLCLYLGGDWGWCYGGGWHHHWDDYGRYAYYHHDGYGHDRYGYDRGYGRGSTYYGYGSDRRSYAGGYYHGASRGNYGGYAGSARGNYSRGGSSFGYGASGSRNSAGARSYSSSRYGGSYGSFGSSGHHQSSSYYGSSSSRRGSSGAFHSSVSRGSSYGGSSHHSGSYSGSSSHGSGSHSSGHSGSSSHGGNGASHGSSGGGRHH